MKRPSSDALRVMLYFVATFLLAALISPWLFKAGKTLGEIVANKETNAFLEWLGASAQNADFDRYFKRSVALAGLILLIPLVWTLKLSARRRIDDGPWSLHLPAHSIRFPDGQPLVKNPHRWLHFSVGFLSAATILLLAGYVGIRSGAFEWRESIDWPKAFRKAIPPAIFASLFEEIFFRGALLGIFIRCLGGIRGTVILSLIFALVHFMVPPTDLQFHDPRSTFAGFRFLGLVVANLLRPDVLLGGVLTLFIVGLILSYARLATASLFLPIGLHAGWVFAYKLFHRCTDAADITPPALWTSPDLRSGLLPLLALGITSIVVWVFLVGTRPAAPPTGKERL